MTLLQIPLEANPDSYQFKTTIGTVIYNIRIQWNTRDERWMLYIFNEADRHLISTPLVVNHPLTQRFHIVELNTSFVLVNLRSNFEVNKEELGRSCVLLVDTEAGL